MSYFAMNVTELPCRVGDLLHAVLVERVAIRHLDGLGVAQVDLLLPAPPLALRELDRHGGRLHPVADGADEPLLLGGLEDVVVLEVLGDRRQPVVALRARLLERLLEQVELELGRDHDAGSRASRRARPGAGGCGAALTSIGSPSSV